MIKEITYISILFLLCASLAHGQTEAERAQALLDSSYQYSRYDYKKCINFVDSSLSFSNYDRESYFEDLSHYYYGICNHRHGRYDEALDQFDKGISSFAERNDTTVLSDLYYQKSLIFRQQSDYNGFLENVNTSLELAEGINYERNIGMCNNAKLIHYKERKMFDRAEECGLKALKIFKTIKDSSSQGDVYNNLGVLMFAQKQFDKAKEYHLAQHDLNTKLNNVWGKGYSHSKLARVYVEQQNYTLAKSHIDEALQITRKIGTPYELSSALLRSAQLNSEIGNFQVANRDIHESIALSKKFEQLNSYADGLKELVGIHEKQNRIDSALIYTNLLMNVKDSVLNKTISKQLSELEVEFETQKKDKEILELKYEDDLNQARIIQQRLIIGGSMIGLCLLGFLFFRVRSKNQKIEEQNNIISTALSEKDMLLREVHHRVKNNLQVISSLLGIQSRTIKDEKAKEAIRDGRSRVHSMSLIHQNLYQKDNLSGIEMSDYLPKLSKSLFDTYNIKGDQIALATDIKEMKLDVETVIPIGLIVNELITNSLKYAFPEGRVGEISILLSEGDGVLNLVVSDNGIGLPNEQVENKQDGFGHKLIKAFRNKLDADIIVENRDGAFVELFIKKYKKLA